MQPNRSSNVPNILIFNFMEAFPVTACNPPPPPPSQTPINITPPPPPFQIPINILVLTLSNGNFPRASSNCFTRGDRNRGFAAGLVSHFLEETNTEFRVLQVRRGWSGSFASAPLTAWLLLTCVLVLFFFFYLYHYGVFCAC